MFFHRGQSHRRTEAVYVSATFSHLRNTCLLADSLPRRKRTLPLRFRECSGNHPPKASLKPPDVTQIDETLREFQSAKSPPQRRPLAREDEALKQRGEGLCCKVNSPIPFCTASSPSQRRGLSVCVISRISLRVRKATSSFHTTPRRQQSTKRTSACRASHRTRKRSKVTRGPLLRIHRAEARRARSLALKCLRLLC